MEKRKKKNKSEYKFKKSYNLYYMLYLSIKTSKQYKVVQKTIPTCKAVTFFNSLISKNVSKMYLWKMSNLNDLWSKNKVKNYGICHLLVREFCMMELPYK
ncbi:Hypothetical_protein [Hexamita inflata]|uniref:Hypothetical_protein n=1 Tax=Hexamita inflata TaxID=28002 RepID=A0AA86UMS2_9EUKA|nr:Hypothetical protein HINF_LOCUS45106 [Hexamita inflata]